MKPGGCCFATPAAAAASASAGQHPPRSPGSIRPAEADAVAAAGAATAGTEAHAAIWAGGCCHSAGRLPPDRRAASAAAGRMLPGDRGGCCPAAGQHPPRSGGCCPAAGQQPPHHSRVLHHACADASWAKKSGSQTNRPPGVLECFSDKIQKGHLHRAEIEISEQGRGWCGVVR